MKGTSAAVVVIGGGLIGASVSYYLAKRGVDVVVLERNELGSGTSRACADGVVLQTKTIGPKLRFAMESLELYLGLEEELEADLEFHQDGGQVVAQTPAEVEFVQSLVKKLSDFGVEARYQDASEVQAFQPALGEQAMGAAYSPQDARVNPLKTWQAFFAAATRLRARVLPFTPVTGIVVHGDKILKVKTRDGAILTDTVVNAAGIWAPEIAAMTGVEPPPIVPRRGQLFVTEPAPPLLNGRVLSASYIMSKKLASADEAGEGKLLAGVIAGQEDTGNFLVGSTREFVGFDRQTTYAGIAELIRQTIQLLPALANVHLIRTFAGLRPATPDGLPILERAPELPGFITAAGHEGDGIALCPITGLRIAQLITGEIEPELLTPFSSSRFRHGSSP